MLPDTLPVVQMAVEHIVVRGASERMLVRVASVVVDLAGRMAVQSVRGRASEVLRHNANT